MRLWSRFLECLASGEPTEGDPSALCELELVPLTMGPIRVSAVIRNGIAAVGIESFNVMTQTRTNMRIMVRRADLAAARQTLAMFDD